MKPIELTQSGQSLPLALVGMTAILALTLYLINVGRLLVAREETRMRTDVAVLSGATIYARCLNVYSLLKKIDKTAKETADTFGKVPYIGPAVTAAYEAIHAAKIAFQESAPYLALSGVEMVAAQNGLIAVPYWNVKDFFEISANVQGLIPSLKLDTNESSSLESKNNFNTDTDHYSYHQYSDHQKIDVENGQVNQDQLGGASSAYRDQKTGRFVHADKAEGEHSLTLLTYSMNDKGNAYLLPGFKRIPNFTSLARARISGGNFDTDSSKSLKWGCFLAPVTVKEQAFGIPAVLH